MIDPHWARVKDVFEGAVSSAPGEREAFLQKACHGDAALLREVRAMLAADEAAESFLETPAIVELEARPAGAPLEGRRVGPYLVERQIGRGGMAVVYLAVRTDPFEQRVALKLIRGGLDSDEILRRFAQERQTLARLNHPNIARLIDGGADERGQPYLVMEYVDGKPLDQFCTEARPSLDARLDLFRTVCAAVHYAHQNLVVHRDLKPANILVTREGAVKLVDFGISKLLSGDARGDATQTLMRLMTPAYASPEEARGEPSSTAADVYSLGVVLYELLTGRRPYDLEGRSAVDTERIITEQEPPAPSAIVMRADWPAAREGLAPPLPPRTLSKRLAGDLDVIVGKALHKSPARRYGSVDQLAADLDRFARGLPVSAKPDTVGYRTMKFVRRHRVGAAAAAMIAASLVGGAFTTLWQARAAEREAQKARRISEYVERVFASASPLEGRRDMTVAESLEAAARRAQEELAGDPEVLAVVRRTIGRTLLEVNRPAEAEPLLRAAYDEQLRIFGDRHEETINTLEQIGRLEYLLGRRDDAERTLRRSVALADAVLPPDHVLRGDIRIFLGLLLTDHGRSDEAVAVSREALAVFERTPGRYGKEVATLTNNLAVNAYNSGRLDEAADLYRQTIALTEAAGNPFDAATAQMNLGVVYRLQKRYVEAEPLLRVSVDTRVRMLGADHLYVGMSRTHLGDLLMRRGDLTTADQELTEAARIMRLLPPNHLDQARPLAALGLLRCRMNRLDEGMALLNEALVIRKKALPAQHWLIASVESALGECLAAAGRTREAESMLRGARTALAAGLGAQHPTTLEAEERLNRVRPTDQ